MEDIFKHLKHSQNYSFGNSIINLRISSAKNTINYFFSSCFDTVSHFVA